ncbi:Glucose-1-phosphate adenylyltransferase large subunit 1, chloroplastic/amyloplastic [Zea mays]|nr:Glucose-1-phosphate adenylyltransferase large subunit 1, chloroplastic/amyloplastic [Zea mays]
MKDAFISDGCLLRECNIEHSVIGVCSRVSSGCELKVHTLPMYMLMFYTFSCII